MPCLDLVADIAGAERGGRKADESIENDEKDIEAVEDKVILDDGRRGKEREARGESKSGGEHVSDGADPVARNKRQDKPGRDGDANDGVNGFVHRRSPRTRSRDSISTLSNRSRMRNTKTAKTKSAIRTEKATLTSTTSGIPRAPVAARMRPFSMDMNPTIWVTALRRVIIIKKPSRMIARASARPSRVKDAAPGVTFKTRSSARLVSPRPRNMAAATFTA